MLEQIKEQKQDQWITTIGDLSLWSISITKNDLFNEASARSLYFVNNNLKQEIKSDMPVILDDDRKLFDRYVDVAVQELLVPMAKRVPQNAADYPELFNSEGGVSITPVYNDSYMFEVNLVMSANHDNNLIVGLRVACKEFIVKKVLEMWYSMDFGSSVELDKVNHILHYRRRSASRRVRPLL